MPYIEQKDRTEELNALISKTAQFLGEMPLRNSFGLEFFAITLARKVVHSLFGKFNYGKIAIVSGVFLNVASELRERLVFCPQGNKQFFWHKNCINNKYSRSLQELAKEIASVISSLAKQNGKEDAFAGILNYTLTSVALETMELGSGDRITLEMVDKFANEFEKIYKFFYKDIAVPYERDKTRENGDLPLYEKYAIVTRP